MELDDLKEEHLVKIIEIYEEHCGSRRSYTEAMCNESPKDVLMRLKDKRSGDYLLGSKWDSHSALWLMERQDGHIEPMFVPNFDPREDKTIEWGDSVYLSIEKANREFAKAAGEYLNKLESH